MQRLFITFETDSRFDEDQARDEQEAAKSIFAALVKSLEKKGANFIAPMNEWDAYGWYAEVGAPNARITFMLQRSDAWLLQVFCKRTFLDWLTGRHREADLKTFAKLVTEAVSEAFGVPQPAVQTEADFTAG